MLRKDQNGAPLAMYPSVGFPFQAQGYVSKGRRSLSDAPSGRFERFWVCLLGPAKMAPIPKIRAGIFLLVSLQVSL